MRTIILFQWQGFFVFVLFLSTACKQKNYVRKGVREVQKYIRKKEEG